MTDDQMKIHLLIDNERYPLIIKREEEHFLISFAHTPPFKWMATGGELQVSAKCCCKVRVSRSHRAVSFIQ